LIEELELGRREVVEMRNLESLSQLLAPAHLLGTDAATLCPILSGECVGFGAVFEQARPFGMRPRAVRSDNDLRSGLHVPIVGVLWKLLWQKTKSPVTRTVKSTSSPRRSTVTKSVPFATSSFSVIRARTPKSCP
jgi:hypothetical protein